MISQLASCALSRTGRGPRSRVSRPVGACVAPIRVAVDVPPGGAMFLHEALNGLWGAALEHFLHRAVRQQRTVAYRYAGIGRAFGKVARDIGRVEKACFAKFPDMVLPH